ncbi:hypothetical protein ACFO0M_09980 [Micromonospora mangrovi]|uniref:Phosphatidate cytidylyltransferase n=2 Tax=Micromonospora TaxID=1873 RepID=A0AAU8HES4_9ACTN
MTDALRTAGALLALVLICLAMWAAAAGVLQLLWTFLLFLIGASA